MLEGKAVSLRLRDKEDVDFLFEFWNNIDYYGDYEAIQPQISKTEVEKRIESSTTSDAGVVWTWFVVEKKDGAKIGSILYFTNQPRGWIELGYALLPSEMGKGYGTEAVQIMVDYLFLAKDIMRVQEKKEKRKGE